MRIDVLVMDEMGRDDRVARLEAEYVPLVGDVVVVPVRKLVLRVHSRSFETMNSTLVARLRCILASRVNVVGDEQEAVELVGPGGFICLDS